MKAKALPQRDWSTGAPCHMEPCGSRALTVNKKFLGNKNTYGKAAKLH
jgi:hypothetical protein